MRVLNKSELIAEELASGIRRGVLTGKLISEKELAKKYSTAVMTAARALNILREQNLVERISGRGTFVISRSVRRLRFFRQSYFAGLQAKLLGSLVPNVELVPVSSFLESDLAVFATTMPMNYSSNFLPWPTQMVESLKASGRFYPQVFEFHHIGTPTYAVAYNFSPDILAYNKRLMRQAAPEFDPYQFTFDELAKLSQQLPGRFMERPAAGNSILFALAYSSASLRRALPAFRRLLFTAPEPGKSFLHGDYLLAPLTRAHCFNFSDFSPFEVMPIPEIDGVRCCHAASEAVFVPLSSRYPELAFELAAASLSLPFQEAVGAARANIPADISIAAESLDSRAFRDDIFFNEIANIHFPREIIDPVSAAVILAGLKRLASCACSLDDFLCLLEEEEHLVQRRRKALAFVLQTQNCAESF
ncbi:MAG: GntR family transcriptional regulator [Porticoccaceae bacterium]|nr:GntR family transcriptional regulator [Porticoccaceae bacterium]